MNRYARGGRAARRDLATGAKKVFVAMEHVAKDKPKEAFLKERAPTGRFA